MDKVRRLQTEAKAIGVYSRDFWARKCIEPIKRNHGRGPEWVHHRFEIKGGISWREAMIRDMCEPNHLLHRMAVQITATP